MAADVTLRLILYGLVAFAPDKDDKPTKLHALLVEATGQQSASDGCKIHRHIPALYVAAKECTFNGGPCRISDEIDPPDNLISGGWRLDQESLQVEVWDPPNTNSKELVMTGGPTARTTIGLPEGKADGDSWDWIPLMSQVKIDPDCLNDARDCPISARLDIDSGTVTSCHLSEAQDSFKVYAQAFKPLNSNVTPILTQALSDAVLVTMTIPRGKKVKLTSKGFRSPNWFKKEIILDAGGSGPFIDIWVTNVPTRDSIAMEHQATCIDNANLVDRHFELYYGLSSEPIPFSDRNIPHRVANSGVDGAKVQPADTCRFLDFTKLDAELKRIKGPDKHVGEHDGEPGKVPMDWNSCGNVRFPALQTANLPG